MKKKYDEKQFDEIISKASDFGKVDFDAQKWHEKYILNESLKRTTIIPHKNIWRFIMENKVTRYSAAAVVALAILFVLSNPFGGSKYSGIVLADVQQKVAGIETMIIRGTKTYTLPDKNDEIFEFNGVKGHFDLLKYFSEQYGLVEEGYVGDELIYRITMNRAKRQTLIVLPRWKKYGTFTSTDKQMKLLENGTPKGIVNLLMEIDYKKLGRDTLNGVETEVFEFQDPVTFTKIMPKAIFDIQSIKGKVWIGIEEQLPVQVEGDLVIGKSLMTMFNDLNLHEFNVLEKCDIELDESIFDINIPDGYTELTLADILSIIPANVKAGAAGAGIGSILIPAGLISWRRRRKKK
ncbi:MAG: hypothetical protein JW715_00145 [Sedimentisphaerales bacterium]|nr:hypothetical protein [Sedimentisphaerales bacterium]